MKERGRSLPRKGREQVRRTRSTQVAAGTSDRLYSLYRTTRRPSSGGTPVITVPPVFIVVCNNTAVSKLVYEWISGSSARTRTTSPIRSIGAPRALPNFDEYGNRRRGPTRCSSTASRLNPATRSTRFPRTRRAGDRAVQAGEGRARRRRCNCRNDLGLRPVARGHEHGRQGAASARASAASSRSRCSRKAGTRTQSPTSLACAPSGPSSSASRSSVGRCAGSPMSWTGEGLFEVEYADILGIPFAFTAKPVAAPISRRSRCSASRRSRSAPRSKSLSRGSRATASNCPGNA